MTPTAIKLVVNLWHDDHPENPAECDGWAVYSFSTNHSNFKHPDEFEEDEELASKLKVGLAFPLSYFEHGECLWSLGGEGPQCRFDTVQHAGFLVWEQDEANIGAKTVEERRADAARFIEMYSEWANGHVYGYTIEAFSKCHACGQDEDADVDFDLPSCGGYYDADIDGMVIDMKDHIGSDWKDYEVKFTDNLGGFLADRCKTLWEAE